MAKQVTLTIDFSFLANPAFRSKIPILAILAVIFAFSGLMFAKAGLDVADFFDIPRYEFNVAKLYSISMVMFVVLFAIAIALSVIYGHGIGLGGALVAFPVLLLVSLVLYAIYPALLWQLLILALSVETAALAGSRAEKITLSSAWGASGKALTVLVLLVFLFVAASVNAGKEAYFDTMLAGGAELAPQLKQQASAVCGELLLSAMDQKMTQEAVLGQVKASVSRETMKNNILAVCPMVSNLNSTQQDALVDASYNQTAGMALGVFSSIKEGIRNSLSANQSTDEAALEETDAAAAMAKQVQDLKQKVFEVPQAKMVYDNLHILIALAVASATYLAKFIIQVISAIICILIVRI